MHGDDDRSNSPDWLWNCRGQLLVISTPYLHGNHCATSPLQLLALVVELVKLHESGYVHGDIRGFNVVFQENVEDDFTATVDFDGKAAEVEFQGFRGRLIDFDFAGMKGADTPKYPKGYRSSLDDGDRLGTAGGAILEYHEWRGVQHILFLLHDMDPPTETSETLLGENGSQDDQDPPGGVLTNNEDLAQIVKRDRLRTKRDRLRGRFALDRVPSKGEIQDLKKFLYKIHRENWSVVLSAKYRTALTNVGLYGPAVTARHGTDHATGTPTKDKYEEGKARGKRPRGHAT
jgi:hypothetical protein